MWKFVYPVENQFKECVWSASDWLHGRTLEKEGAGKLPGLSDTFLNSESKTRVYFFIDIMKRDYLNDVISSFFKIRQLYPRSAWLAVGSFKSRKDKSFTFCKCKWYIFN